MGTLSQKNSSWSVLQRVLTLFSLPPSCFSGTALRTKASEWVIWFSSHFYLLICSTVGEILLSSFLLNYLWCYSFHFRSLSFSLIFFFSYSCFTGTIFSFTSLWQLMLLILLFLFLFSSSHCLCFFCIPFLVHMFVFGLFFMWKASLNICWLFAVHPYLRKRY